MSCHWDARLVGLQKTSAVDFPGTIAATVFLSGCNLRCPFCHNPDLAVGRTPLSFQPIDKVLRFLERRADVLGGVCISGGEPLLYDGLPDLTREIHELGLLVKLDTNGLLPDRLLAAHPDYVAMDLKTSPRRYRERLLGPATELDAPTNPFDRVRASMAVLRESGLHYEYRTTVVPTIVERDDAWAILAELQPRERWFLQQYRRETVLDSSFERLPATDGCLLEEIRRRAEERGVLCSVRDG